MCICCNTVDFNRTVHFFKYAMMFSDSLFHKILRSVQSSAVHHTNVAWISGNLEATVKCLYCLSCLCWCLKHNKNDCWKKKTAQFTERLKKQCKEKHMHKSAKARGHAQWNNMRFISSLCHCWKDMHSGMALTFLSKNWIETFLTLSVLITTFSPWSPKPRSTHFKSQKSFSLQFYVWFELISVIFNSNTSFIQTKGFKVISKSLLKKILSFTLQFTAYLSIIYST